MGKTCCGASNKKVEYTYKMQKHTIKKKDLEVVAKWTHGCVARRRLKKMLQLAEIQNMKKPIYKDGELVKVEELLMDEDDIAFQISPQGDGKGLYWDTFFKKIGDGRQYRGQWRVDKRKSTWEGLGTIIYPDGSKYQGMTKKGKFEGKGRMIHANGDIYQGEWRDGKAMGHGVFIDQKGSMYDGQWLNDMYHGKGTEQWNYNKIVYTGDFVEGKKTGKARFEFEGNFYEGDFLEGQFHGEGKYYFAESGKIYEGEFVENNMTGTGTMVWPDGAKYTGDFQAGQRHGKGLQIFANGDKYEGEWADDLRHGEGLYSDHQTLKQRKAFYNQGEEYPMEEGAELNTSPWRSMRRTGVPVQKIAPHRSGLYANRPGAKVY